LILGPIAEQGFVQAWIIGEATGNLTGMFFRPADLAGDHRLHDPVAAVSGLVQSRRAKRLLEMQANSND
jgi:putative tricarboxylic transport membrane protein